MDNQIDTYIHELNKLDDSQKTVNKESKSNIYRRFENINNK